VTERRRDTGSIRIRDERPDEVERVHELQTAAFGRRSEADLVDALRASADPQLSLVAEQDGRIVGHAFFSPVTIDATGSPPAAGLAPVGVWPQDQGRGVGSALVRAGLGRCPALGWQAVFLVGSPAYYGRFGFELAAPRGFHYHSELFDSVFQVIELEADALGGLRGFVRYHPALESMETEAPPG
jgi:putative acetyltransferase